MAIALVFTKSRCSPYDTLVKKSPVTKVPETNSTFALLGFGALSAIYLRRRRKRSFGAWESVTRH